MWLWIFTGCCVAAAVIAAGTAYYMIGFGDPPNPFDKNDTFL